MNIAIAQELATKSAAASITGVDSILQASPIVKFALFLLIGMSIVCWAIIFSKVRQFRKCDQNNNPFLDLFWKASSLDAIFSSVTKHNDSNMARVFKTGYLELQKIADSNLAQDKNSEKPLLSGIDNLERSLHKSIDSEIAFLESRLGFLATTGSTGPFIGLFGTVLGIMNSFEKIGETNMANLAVVAPGISEALFATAIGLGAAIPATVAYNHFIGRLRRQELELNNFASDFLNIAKRNFFKGQ